MEFIAHRINTSAELENLSNEYGTELDLRDNLNGRIYIQHNPFENGEDFERYLEAYHHGTMILNVKSERIEHKILEMIKNYDVNNYFFLDSTFRHIMTAHRNPCIEPYYDSTYYGDTDVKKELLILK